MSEGADLPRFATAERVVHAAVAVLMFACLVTAAILYNGSLMLLVGHRHLVETVHVWSGLALPVPMLLGLASAAYRLDLRRLDRFTADDRRWLRSRSRRDGAIRVGKFNAGQKLNAWLVAGATGVLLGTGTLMYWTGLVRLSWRSGATFVHDWSAIAIGLLVIGHLVFAFRDPEARRGMRTGRVSARWARAQHAAWVEELAVERAAERGDTGVDGRRTPS
ncbi:cytochrome b/b6 domain-containing protein [Nocardioides sp. BP30]|uniref:cytochrome b/b6 domain-containing protein n=1 Tax=Nocardioides sp. BP30 TaxID=3036374 RepID=UPI002468B12F|nr:cytochrome b/b6 domain-containing protein [Nocardioides sp. BP30]WGL52119.1 cytochrome b/b6 domain-containing protein [Nocardioides sp. BP30]